MKTQIFTVNGVSGCSHASEDGVCPGGAGMWSGQTPLRHCGSMPLVHVMSSGVLNANVHVIRFFV